MYKFIDCDHNWKCKRTILVEKIRLNIQLIHLGTFSVIKSLTLQMKLMDSISSCLILT